MEQLPASFDRWKTAGPEPDEVGRCVACDGEIYEGEHVLLVDGELLHDDVDCLVRYAKEALCPVQIRAGERQ